MNDFYKIVEDISRDEYINKDDLYLLVVETAVTQQYDDVTFVELQRRILPFIHCDKIRSTCKKLLTKKMQPHVQDQDSTTGKQQGGDSKLEQPRGDSTPGKQTRKVYTEGQSVEYRQDDKWLPAEILRVHTNDKHGLYYTLKKPDGTERQTVSDRLRPQTSTSPSCSAGA